MRAITFPRQDDGSYVNSETGVRIRRHAGRHAAATGLWVVIRPNRRDGLLYTTVTSLAAARREAVDVVEAVRAEIAEARLLATFEKAAREATPDELRGHAADPRFSPTAHGIFVAEVSRRAAARPTEPARAAWVVINDVRMLATRNADGEWVIPNLFQGPWALLLTAVDGGAFEDISDTYVAPAPVEYGPIDKAAILRQPPVESLMFGGDIPTAVEEVEVRDALSSLARPFAPTAVYPLGVTVEEYKAGWYRVMIPTPGIIIEAWSSATPNLADAHRQAEKAAEFMRNLRDHDHAAALREYQTIYRRMGVRIMWSPAGQDWTILAPTPNGFDNLLRGRFGDFGAAMARAALVVEEVHQIRQADHRKAAWANSLRNTDRAVLAEAAAAFDTTEIDRATDIANARRMVKVHGRACPYGGCDSCDPSNADIDAVVREYGAGILQCSIPE